MSDLKPCPACGGEGFVEVVTNAFFGCCSNQDCEMAGPSRKTREDAASAWNALPRNECPDKYVHEAVFEEVQETIKRYLVTKIFGIKNDEEDKKRG